MSDGVVLFIEGDTEYEFYGRLLDRLHSLAPEGKFQVEKVLLRNLRGIGNYKNRAKRVFEKEIINRNPGINFTVVLCYDTDVFDFSSKPVVVWPDVERELKKCGAKNVIHVKAKRSIEDWFLNDSKGVLNYLRLSLHTNVPKSGGANSIKELFKKADRVYVKGSSIKGFVNSLDVKLIMSSICPELKNLCKVLGIKCKRDKCKM